MACLAGKKGCPGPGGTGDFCFTCRSLAKTSAATATQVKFPGIKAPEAKPVPKDPPHIIVLPTTGADGSPKIALYRGDTRGPGNMKKHGVELWGAAIACVFKAGGMSNYLRAKCAELVDGRSLAQLIVVSKNQQRPTISTSQHPGCGGYSSDFVYKIELKEFLSQFSRYAERSLYLTDVCVDVSRSPDLFVSEKAREIAPVNVAGIYGSEVLRHAR